jgi:murein L,D-transpeptidase YafK
LNRPSWVRSLLASAAIVAAFALAGCDTDGFVLPDRALKELTPEMISLLQQKNMPRESAILVRIFKEESEMEVWKQDDSGRFAMLKTYPICRWSGELGPKVREGDRQAPEGFYNITPGLMNPNSNYFLSFNLGFPNAYDRANDRTGAFLMVHGDCSSRGCYAMTDEQIGEIFSLARESFTGGQRSFQVQAYPFRMTPMNMAKHRNNPAFAFWRMLKEGNDHFEVTRMEPKIDVCEKRYVFNAYTPGDPTQSPAFNNPRGACPRFEVPADLAAAVREKSNADEQEFASLVNRNVSTVAVKTGTDGGMHPMFAARMRAREIFDANGRVQVAAHPREDTTGALAVADPGSRPGQLGPTTKVASTDANSGGLLSGWFGSRDAKPAEKSAEKSEGTLDKLGKWFGLRGSSTPSAPTQTAAAPAAKPKPTHMARPQPKFEPKVADAPKTSTPPTSAPAATKTASSVWPSTPPGTDVPANTATASAAPASMNGTQPIRPSSSFDSRWGGLQ